MSAEEQEKKSRVRRAAEVVVKISGLTAFWSVFGPVLVYKLWKYNKRESCKRD
jgi:hypothetical protein